MAVADIILSPATVWYAPVGETLPDENLIDYGEAWGGNWVSVGYTSIPLSVSLTRETYEVMVEQLTTPVREMIIRENLLFETALAELTGDNLLLALGGTLTETAAGAAQRAMDELEMGGDPDIAEYAFGFEGFYKDAAGTQFPVRLFVYKGVAIMNGALQFSKAQASTIPMQIKAKADTSKVVGKQLVKIQKVTATGTS